LLSGKFVGDVVAIKEGYDMELLRLFFGCGDVTKDETRNLFEAGKAILRILAVVEGSGCLDDH